MEGYDSEADGSPSLLTKRRYLRYADGAVVLSGLKLYLYLPGAGQTLTNIWINKSNISVLRH